MMWEEVQSYAYDARVRFMSCFLSECSTCLNVPLVSLSGSMFCLYLSPPSSVIYGERKDYQSHSTNFGVIPLVWILFTPIFVGHWLYC